MKYELRNAIEEYYKKRPQLPQPEKSVIGYVINKKMLPFIEYLFDDQQDDNNDECFYCQDNKWKKLEASGNTCCPNCKRRLPNAK